MKKTMLLLAMGSLLLAGCANNQNTPTVILPAEEISSSIQNQNFARIYQGVTSEFRNDISKKDFENAIADFTKGEESWPTSTELNLNNKKYKALSNPAHTRGIILLITEKKEIDGLKLVPLEKFPHTDEAFTKLTYSLPFKGNWFTFWGGEDVLANYHYETPSQRYAYDFLIEKDGYTYSGDPKKNESYYAFGQEITAPEAGKVVHVVSDIADNEPVGTMNEKDLAGNIVVIDHGNGEYSQLAHLKKDSVTVKVGDIVQKGDVIGLCGNSGNSSEPHLHFQLSDGEDLFTSNSVRVKWENDLHPIQGDTITAK